MIEIIEPMTHDLIETLHLPFQNLQRLIIHASPTITTTTELHPVASYLSNGQISYKRIPDLVVVLVPHPSLNPQKSETSFGSHHPCVFGFCARPITANEPNIQDINLSPNISMDIRFGYITICMGICQICMYCSVISHLSRVDL